MEIGLQEQNFKGPRSTSIRLYFICLPFKPFTMNGSTMRRPSIINKISIYNIFILWCTHNGPNDNILSLLEAVLHTIELSFPFHWSLNCLAVATLNRNILIWNVNRSFLFFFFSSWDAFSNQNYIDFGIVCNSMLLNRFNGRWIVLDIMGLQYDFDDNFDIEPEHVATK